jgi:hypothetical protein
MKRRIPAIIIILVILFAVIGYLSSKKSERNISTFDECVLAGYPVQESYPRKCSVPEIGSWTEDIGNSLEKANLILLQKPRPGDFVSNPVEIAGEARGYWFFEASAPVVVEDSSGAILGTGIIQATDEWMTEDFVKFSGQITFANPRSGTGRLVLKKDNPSGLSENDDSMYIPIKFK